MSKALHDLKNNALTLKILIKNLYEESPENREIQLASEAINRLMDNLKEIDSKEIDTSK